MLDLLRNLLAILGALVVVIFCGAIIYAKYGPEGMD